MLDGAAVSYRLVLTKADKVKATELAEVERAHRRRGAQARRRPSRDHRHVERNRAGDGSVARGGDRGGAELFDRVPKRETTAVAQAHHRQQGLFLLVAAGLAGGQAVGPALRGDHRPDVRRGLGQEDRGRRVRAVGRQGADPVGRPDRDLGQPRDHRMARRQDRPGALLAARRRRPRHGPLDGRARCTPPTRTCAASCR